MATNNGSQVNNSDQKTNVTTQNGDKLGMGHENVAMTSSRRPISKLLQALGAVVILVGIFLIYKEIKKKMDSTGESTLE